MLQLKQKTSLACALSFLPLGSLQATLTSPSNIGPKDYEWMLRSAFVPVESNQITIKTPVDLASSHTTFGASEQTLSDTTLFSLGEHSSERLRRFRNTKEGWHFGNGKAMSRASLQNTESFLAEYGASMADEYGFPSVFLNQGGDIELLWRNGPSASIHLTFLTNGMVEFNSENPDMEGVSSRSDAYWAVTLASA